jgi:hypothetical protein
VDERSKRMPERVYTVGDTIRLEVSFLSEANVEEVRAVFRRHETYTQDEEGHSMRDVSQSIISLEGTVEKAEIAEQRPFALPLKRHTAVLLSFVDRDHSLGSYQLMHVALRTASGHAFQFRPEPGDPVTSFRVAEEPDWVQGFEAMVVEEEPEGD